LFPAAAGGVRRVSRNFAIAADFGLNCAPFMSGRELFILAILLAALGSGACGNPKLVNEGGKPTGTGAPPDSVPPGVPGFTLPDAGSVRDGGPPSTGTLDMACASESHEAKQVPLDIVLLVDTSGSMYELAGMQPKWVLTQNALRSFVKDPKSAGLGIGLQFFPLGGDDRMCNADADCDTTSAALPGSCAPKSVCTTAGKPVLLHRPCNPTALNPNEICPFGGTCTLLGRCSMGGASCYQIGQPCPGGGGMCAARATTCRNIGTGSCNVADYEKPAVPIGELPAAEPGISAVIDRTEPIGATPTAQAVQGTLNYLRQHLSANPGRRGALVLFTDGLPFGDCGTSEAPVRLQILGAQQGTPSISTYVIGVFGGNQPNFTLDTWARVGGTDRATVLSPTEDLTQRFLDTLNQIRGRALPCEFTIPPQSGAVDYNKVNVRVTAANGSTGQDLLYVTSVDRCDATNGGWYYDVDPATGRPTRVIVCPATCNRFKAEAASRLDLLFGCATRVIQ
jgi:hypothetical protein